MYKLSTYGWLMIAVPLQTIGEHNDQLRDLGRFPRTMIPHDLGETSPMPGFFCYLPSLPFNPNQIKHHTPIELTLYVVDMKHIPIINLL